MRKIVGPLVVAAIATYLFSLDSFQANYIFDDETNYIFDDHKLNNISQVDANGGRSAYGYRHPRHFQRIIHTSHNCTIPSASGEYSSSRKVHILTGVPHIILIGSQKSGTSTVQGIFNGQQNIHKPAFKRTFEPHFFDWDMGLNTKLNFNASSLSQGELCKWREAYSQYFDMSKIKPNVSVVFEKTPSYMLFPSIADVVNPICPWKPKILAILRNPVDRAWSQFQMDDKKKQLDFVKQVNKEMEQLQKNGILEKALTIQAFEHSGGIHPFQFPTNMTLFDYAQKIRDFSGNRANLIIFRGLYAPLLYPWVRQFAADDRLMVLQFETFMKAENEHNTTILKELLGFAGLEEFQNSTTTVSDTLGRRKLMNHQHYSGRRRLGSNNDTGRRKLVWKHGRRYDPMPPRIRHYLTMFYQPFNDMLADLLGEDWRDIWD